jgi:murein DD-endopeptidase MepM/ murein hydrolase activator NlpD
VWGAIDLALDGNDDGYAEPDTTFGAPVVATHHGVARVFPNSWPGGNFIILDHAESGYSTAYGHLDTIMITDGQFIEAGTQIGTIGTTGMSSGPHLHYEIRTPHGNIDPAPLVGCG